MGCAAAAAIVEKVLAGASVPEADVAEAIAHRASCATCRERFDIADLAACVAVEDQLLERTRLQVAGEDPGGRWPELDGHLAACARCRAALDDLSEETVMEPASEAIDLPRSGSRFERWLTSALGAPEPIVRLRACERLGELDHLGTSSTEALNTTAEHDPDQAVRDAAVAALRHFDWQVAAAASYAPMRIEPKPEDESEDA